MELFNEFFSKRTRSWKDFFPIVYGEGLSEDGTFQLYDFSLYSEGARKEFILKLAVEDYEVLDKFLKNVYMAILIEAPFLCDNRLEEKPRELLLVELLHWAEWGVDVHRLPIYQVAFALIYYRGINAYGYEFESYQIYNEEFRALVINGICTNGFTNILDAFVLNSCGEINFNCDLYTKKWRKVGVPRHLALLFEFSNWCDWGADIPSVTEALWKILYEYADRQDSDGFCAAFELCGEYLTSDMLSCLRQTVMLMKFYNSETEKAFKNVLCL